MNTGELGGGTWGRNFREGPLRGGGSVVQSRGKEKKSRVGEEEEGGGEGGIEWGLGDL